MWNSPSKEYTQMPDGSRVCVTSEWQLRSNPSISSPKLSPKISAPVPSPTHAPEQALLPPSLEEAALKLEAGQRNALEEELEEWEAAAAPHNPVELRQATDLQAWQTKELALVLARDHKFGGVLRAGGAVLLAVILLWLLGVSGSGEQPAPDPVDDLHHNLLGSECLWHWKAFRCSTGCKPRMHWPVLQGACTPM